MKRLVITRNHKIVLRGVQNGPAKVSQFETCAVQDLVNHKKVAYTDDSKTYIEAI